jgi:CheY-like chemotaxis protein
VLTDLQMPEMDGLELVAAVRSTHPLVPVVLMTACGSEELAIRALRAGAASFVPKQDLARDLSGTLEQVLALANPRTGPQRLLAYLTVTESQFVLDNDPALVLALVVHYQEALTRLQLCDATSRIRMGIALQEALLNGLYHGNLELGPDRRQDAGKTYALLAEERRHMQPYRERRLHVGAKLSRHEARFVIRDEGPGFEVASLPDPADPANLGKGRGRGLLLIRTFMDEVSYNASGNQITLVKRRDL